MRRLDRGVDKVLLAVGDAALALGGGWRAGRVRTLGRCRCRATWYGGVQQGAGAAYLGTGSVLGGAGT